MVTGDTLKVLTGFHHQAARWITGMTEKYGAGGKWEYSSVEEAMDATGLHPIRVYIKRRQTNIAEMVALHPVYSLCTNTERMTGTSRMVRWWDQDTVNEPEEYSRKRCN